MSSEFCPWPSKHETTRKVRLATMVKARLALGRASANADHILRLLRAGGAVEDPERLYQEWLANLLHDVRAAQSWVQDSAPANPPGPKTVADYLGRNHK